MTKLFTAAEIAAKNLPDLPTTTRGIQLRAKKEEWHYESKVGLGGVRKLYEIPAYYLPGYKPYADEVIEGTKKATPSEGGRGSSPVAGAILNGAIVDSKQLASAMRALDEYLKENGLVIDEPEVKAEIVAILYKYLQKGALGDDLEELLRVVMR